MNRRPMNDSDLASMLGGAQRRVSAKRPRHADPTAQVLADLLKSHPFRTSRMLRDLRWFHKQANKRGVYPEG